jgi:DNA-binding response OmpR family regulator
VAKILVVEDDRDLNKAYCIILKHEGHDVVEAFDGKEALTKLKEFKPELVLLDLLMPIMGGLEFLQKWASSKPKDVKVLIFTNMENSPEISEAYNLGASRCIIKSWTAPHNLSKVVTDTLENNDTESSSKKIAKAAA